MKSKSNARSMKKRNKTNSRSKLGGSAIASGGYGCVFKPAIKCKGSSSRTSGVTKVLLNRHASSEMLEITNVKRIIQRIPNYNEYFLGLDAVSCELDPLSIDDKVGFDSKCNNLTKQGINSTNVNMNLNKIKGINVPYGGLELQTFFNSYKLTPYTFVNVNNNLIKLLKNGVSPMNNLKLFHFDLKGPNILISDDYKARVIDWGLSASQIANEVPDTIKTRPFMYNAPYSVCVFDSTFKPFIKQKIGGMISSIGTNIFSLNEIRNDIKVYMIKWLYQFINKGGRGHYDYLNSLLNNLLLIEYQSFPLKIGIDVPSGELPKLISYSFLNEFIADELTDIVIQYTNLSGDFNDEKYFNNAFKYNVDVWGLLTCYVDDLVRLLLDGASNNLTKNNTNSLLYGIREIAYKYMFNGKQLVNPISIDILARDLKQLNDIFGRVGTPSPVASLSPPAPAPLYASSPRTIVISSSSKSSPSIVPIGPVVPLKKTRKRKVVCDEDKKRKCISMGKVCNEATGRCNKL